MADMWHVKIYGAKLLNSSVWVGSTKDIKVLWVTLLSLADEDGRVLMSLPGLAKNAELTIEETDAALEFLQRPDPHSQTPDHEGRRVLQIDGGWKLITYVQHRDYRTSKQIRDAERKARYRAEQLALTGQTGHVPLVPETPGTNRPEVEVEVEVDNCKTTEQTSVAIVPKVTLPARKANSLEAVEKNLAAMMHQITQSQNDNIRKTDIRRAAAELVFAYWARRTNHPGALLDSKRESRIARHMKENGDNVHELLFVVDGWFNDKTFQRLAAEGNKLDGIQNMFTDRERVERLAGHCKEHREGKHHPMAVKYLTVTDDEEKIP